MVVEPLIGPPFNQFGLKIAMSGRTVPGPVPFGAVARATITQTEPMTRAKAEVAQTCRRDRI